MTRGTNSEQLAREAANMESKLADLREAMARERAKRDSIRAKGAASIWSSGATGPLRGRAPALPTSASPGNSMSRQLLLSRPGAVTGGQASPSKASFAATTGAGAGKATAWKQTSGCATVEEAAANRATAQVNTPPRRLGAAALTLAAQARRGHSSKRTPPNLSPKASPKAQGASSASAASAAWLPPSLGTSTAPSSTAAHTTSLADSGSVSLSWQNSRRQSAVSAAPSPVSKQKTTRTLTPTPRSPAATSAAADASGADATPGILLDGSFDEAAEQASFQAAVAEWRSSGSHQAAAAGASAKNAPATNSGQASRQPGVTASARAPAGDHRSGSLYGAPLDEAAEHALFRQAVEEWRSGGSTVSTAQPSAAGHGNPQQHSQATYTPRRASQADSARQALGTARPLTYFERLQLVAASEEASRHASGADPDRDQLPEPTRQGEAVPDDRSPASTAAESAETAPADDALLAPDAPLPGRAGLDPVLLLGDALADIGFQAAVRHASSMPVDLPAQRDRDQRSISMPAAGREEQQSKVFVSPDPLESSPSDQDARNSSIHIQTQLIGLGLTAGARLPDTIQLPEDASW